MAGEGGVLTRVSHVPVPGSDVSGSGDCGVSPCEGLSSGLWERGVVTPGRGKVLRDPGGKGGGTSLRGGGLVSVDRKCVTGLGPKGFRRGVVVGGRGWPLDPRRGE